MKRRIVFAGDSITHGGPWQYWLPNHYVTNFAFPGHTTSDLDQLIPAIVESQPEILIVMIGTNDFGKYRLPEDEVINNILRVARKIKENLPNIPVIWSSLTPRSDEFSQSMVAVNKSIQPELETLGFIFHDIYPLLKDKHENKLEIAFCEDPETFGLHLNSRGYEKWFEFLGPLLNDELSKI
jgi:lysophospholipase L1-like esterase